jgi:hypothetical protein
MRYLFAVALLVTVAAHGQVDKASGLGSAIGVVLDNAGRPLAGATVYALPEEDMTKQIRTTSDAAGRFTLAGLPAGGVYLDAFKESDGYPYGFFSFYLSPGQRTPLKIKVTAGKATPNVVIQLGLRAAYIQLDVRDEDGTPVNGGVSFDRPDTRGPYTRSANATELLMVPPVPLRLTFEAAGYLPWHYGGPRWQGKEGLITLKSGETLRLSIRLKRSL